jgi:hypothetical protein
MNAHTHSPGGHANKRPTRLVALALAPIIALLALASASPALASTPEWTRGGTGLTTALPIEWTGKLKFQDEKLVISCEGTGSGTVAPLGLGEITKWTFNCTSLQGCTFTEKPTFEALALPWHTELVEHSGIVSNLLNSQGHGLSATSRFQLKCNTSVEKVNEECVLSEPLAGSLTKTKTGVTETIGKLKGTCFYRTKQVELVEGSLAVKLTGGGELWYRG